MIRKSPLPELLAPAGSPDALYAAVEAGADAVYLGVRAFNARANAVNFSPEALERALAYCRLRGRRVHITLNTLLYDREINEYLRTVEEIAELGADAVIVADAGAISLIHRHFPELSIHASTQLSIHSSDGARLAHKMGAERAVLARELSLDDIRRVTAEAPIETEIFIHGALCVSHSGQCLFSSLVGGRSGNRGECAQPCRLPYSGDYPLSLRDLCLAPHIPNVIDSGVASLKIEGRMKSPDYVYRTVSIYRRLLDERRAASRDELDELRRIFSRDGFTDGYFSGNKFSQMNGIRREEDKKSSAALEGEINITPSAIPLRAEAKIVRGEAATLTLSCDTKSATAVGAIPREAISAPLSESDVKARLSKLGGTFFTLSNEDVTLTLDPSLNLSPGEINELRRSAVAALCAPESKVTGAIEPSVPKLPHSPAGKTAVCRTAEQFYALKASGYYDEIYLSLDAVEACQEGDLPDGVHLPPVIFDSESSEVYSALKRARARGVSTALCSNLGQIERVRELGFEASGDFRLNVTNRHAAEYYRLLGLRDLILSPELTLPRLRDMAFGRTVVYGRIPLMLLERCVITRRSGCESCTLSRGEPPACRAATELRDRRGARFPLLPERGHRNTLINCVPTYMGDRDELLKKNNLRAIHFIFTTETAEECRAVTDAFKNRRPLGGDVRRIQS